MNSMHYVGLDIHKKSISSCVRQADGTIVQESTIAATHQALDRWMEQLPQPWVAGMEATMFTGWIYDHLNSRGAIAKVGHPAMLKAIGAGKKKNDHIDARKISNLLRCDYFQNVIWRHGKFGTAGACCGTAIFWYGKQCG